MLVNSGRDLQAQSMGGDITAFAATATASSATSITSTGFAASPAYVGKVVLAGSTAANFVYGIIVSHSTTVLTVDRWYNPASPGGVAASTPSTTAPLIVLPFGAGAPFMGLTANSGAAAGADTTLTGEIATASGGLIRKLATYAHTAGVASYTITGVFTANGSDSLPVTVAKMGTFNSLVVGGVMAFETLLNATATMSLSGDQLTVTDTVTQS